MLIPRFSIRTLLVITTIVALCAVFVHQAIEGSLAAAAVGIAIASFVATMLFYLLCFALTWVVAQVTAPAEPDRNPATTKIPAHEPLPRAVPAAGDKEVR